MCAPIYQTSSSMAGRLYSGAAHYSREAFRAEVAAVLRFARRAGYRVTLWTRAGEAKAYRIAEPAGNVWLYAAGPFVGFGS